MLSRFINSFQRNDGDEQRAFQAKVLSMLQETRPDREFILADDPLTLKCGESVIGLTNLRANFLLTDQTDADLRELLDDTIVQVIDSMADAEQEKEWSVAEKQLMPQLMPVEYLSRLDVVSRPFGDTVVIGYVLDSEKTYSYVTERTLSNWGVTLDDLHETAIENLDQRSKGLEATVIEGTNGLIAVGTLDGFDATRILLPVLREKFAEILSGEEFFFGIPNRDFLICWSVNGDAQFQQQMRAQIAADSESRPYPLSGRTFVARADGSISVEEPAGEIDPRAESAELN